MKTIKIVGIDYSLSSPAMCILDPSKTFEKSKFHLLSSSKKNAVPNKNINIQLHSDYTHECQRYDQIANFFIKQLENYDLIQGLSGYKVFLEDYSFGSKGRVFHIAENAGLLKYKLYKLGIPVVLIPPTVLKKFATGKGNANKDLMYESFRSKFPTAPDLQGFYFTKKQTKVDSPVSDIVDAFFLGLYGAQ